LFRNIFLQLNNIIDLIINEEKINYKYLLLIEVAKVNDNTNCEIQGSKGV